MRHDEGTTLLQLQVFITVMETGSVSRACERLSYLNPSSVSYHIRRLEAAYGTPLFRRTSQGMLPTEAGYVLQQAAREALHRLQQAETAVQALRGSLRGSFVIGTQRTVFQLTSYAYQAFREKYPDVAMRFISYPGSHEAFEGLTREESQVTLTCRRADESTVESRHFVREPLLLVVSVRHRLARADGVSLDRLSHEHLATYVAGSEAREAVDEELARTCLHFGHVHEYLTSSKIKESLVDGSMLAILPESVVQAELMWGSVRALTVPSLGPLGRDIYVSYLRRNQSLARIHDLIRLARAVSPGGTPERARG